MKLLPALLFLTTLLFVDKSFSDAPTVKLDVSVINQVKEPLENVHLNAAYQGSLKNDGAWVEANTDSNGCALLIGQSIENIPVSASKTGYYDSKTEVETVFWDYERSENVYSNKTVTLELLEKVNPVPLLCWPFSAVLSNYNHACAFDLLNNDWVSPLGSGTYSDLLFTVSGFYTNRRNYNSLLTLNFQNPNDGFSEFEAHSHSQLKSAHKAPVSGYIDTKSWRKKRIPIPGERRKSDIHEDKSPNANYYFRFRTGVDKNGLVTNAFYGKMYGDFDFGGAYTGGCYIRGGFIYINPTPNDRNLEFDPDNNLYKNLERWEQPRDI